MGSQLNGTLQLANCLGIIFSLLKYDAASRVSFSVVWQDRYRSGGGVAIVCCQRITC